MTDSALIRLVGRLAAARGLRLPQIERLASSVQLIDVAARRPAFREDEYCTKVFVVRRGIFKQLYTAPDGAEAIKSFAAEGEPFACPLALAGGRTSFASVAIETSQVEAVEWSLVEALASQDVEWQRAVRYAYQALAEVKVRRERDLLMCTAEQLYWQLADEHREFIRRVPQKDLAAYLGVTPVGLNRIIRRGRRPGR